MAWRVEFSSAAASELRQLIAEVRSRVATRIDALALDPHPRGSKKLAGEQSGYRIRVGDYRVLYEIQQRRVILIVKVGHRGEVYRRR